MAVRYFVRLFFYVLLGVAVNLALLWMRRDRFATVPDLSRFDVSMSEPLFMVLMLLSFPMIYLVLGHRQGMAAAGYFAARTYRVTVMEFLLRQVFRTNPEWLDDLRKSGDEVKARMGNLGRLVHRSGFVQRLAFQQLAMRFSKLTGAAGMIATIDEAIDRTEKWGGTPEIKLVKLSESLGETIHVRGLKPTLKMPVIVVFLNVVSVLFVPAVFPVLLRLIELF